jgi:threonyl-tRNA synthetase
MEELDNNDHRRIGSKLELFVISDLVGRGLPILLPKGAILRDELEKLIKEEKSKLGYQFVYSPHIAKKEIYIKSGHMGRYDAMMPVMTDENGDEFVIKAMNCPHHFEIYKAYPRSYRDLPLRIAENGTVYRNEKSGELAGLLRVKNLTIDDTHHFVREDQIQSEIDMVFDLIEKIYKIFGFKEYEVGISVRNPTDENKYFGDDKVWDKAEKILVESVKKRGVKYSVDEDEAAFYGPKIDFRVKDSQEREWQLTTIQLDFNQPENFDLEYVGEDGKNHKVVILHIAILGSFERFLGIIIEHYSGSFPLWLSPVQVKILPIGEGHFLYATEVMDKLKAENIRVELDASDETLGKKIRDFKTEKVPYALVIGDKEVAENKVTLEQRDGAKSKGIEIEELISKLKQEIKDRQ